MNHSNVVVAHMLCMQKVPCQSLTSPVNYLAKLRKASAQGPGKVLRQPISMVKVLLTRQSMVTDHAA